MTREILEVAKKWAHQFFFLPDSAWESSYQHFFFFFDILLDLNQVVHDHLAGESQTRSPDTGWSGGVSGWRVWLSSARWSGTAWFKSDKISKKEKKTFRVGGPQSPFSISSSFILFFILLPFFLKSKKPAFLCVCTCVCTHASATGLGKVGMTRPIHQCWIKKCRFFWTEPELHDSIPRFQFFFRFPNTPVSEFLILDVSHQILLGFLAKYEKKDKTVTKR